MLKNFAGICLLLIAAAGSLSAQSGGSAQSAGRDEAAIIEVTENFQRALINKDRPLFLSLFLEGNIGWQPVTEDKSLARLKMKQPAAVKVFIEPKENYLSFIDFIVKAGKRTEETFSNIKIITDGDVASIAFDYAFLFDKTATNYGQEHWLLVRTGKGWKITSVVWSETLPASIEPK